MSKNPINKKIIARVVRISQEIEGYTKPDTTVIQKAQSLREKYGIKVSSRR